ncbi:MAG: sugar phosphate isomerase/epimerase family protein [Kiritimatiellia bacterium]
MVKEVLALGLDRMELGYDTRVDLLPGIEKMLDSEKIQVDSVHNYCPVPLGAPRGHPELWTFADLDQRMHELAVQHTLRTMQFASDIGAKIVVIHCGYVQQRKTSTRDLMDLVARNQLNSPRYEKQFMKFVKERDKRVGRHFDQVVKALEYLLPQAETLNVQLGLENLPTLEAVPNEGEMELLIQQFQHPMLKYWHDLGHGQIRENLGFIHHMHWLERLTPALGGLHLHDVAGKLQDHVMPPDGELGLARFRPWSELDLPLVIEPSPRATFAELQSCVAWLKHWWEDAPQPEVSATEKNSSSLPASV